MTRTTRTARRLAALALIALVALGLSALMPNSTFADAETGDLQSITRVDPMSIVGGWNGTLDGTKVFLGYEQGQSDPQPGTATIVARPTVSCTWIGWPCWNNFDGTLIDPNGQSHTYR